MLKLNSRSFYYYIVKGQTVSSYSKSLEKIPKRINGQTEEQQRTSGSS